MFNDVSGFSAAASAHGLTFDEVVTEVPAIGVPAVGQNFCRSSGKEIVSEKILGLDQVVEVKRMVETLF